jgi:hypothetical protein
MKGKRTGVDFSKHEVIVTEQPGLLVHYLRQPNTIHNCIKYINTNGIMAVTGDFGNWIFCREFHPSKEGGVSDGYWKEKLGIASTQKASDYSSKLTEQRIKEAINGGMEKYGYKGDKLKAVKYFLTECLDHVENEHEYVAYAYQNHPGFMDTEEIPFQKETKPWLLSVFDGFDEICRRIKAGELPEQQKATA